MKTLVWIAVALAAAVVLARLLLPRLGDSVAGGVQNTADQARLADCPESPNCQGSQSTDPARRVDALPASDSISQSLEALEAVLLQQPGAAIVQREGAYLHATFTSRLMGYVDDVEFLVDPNAQQLHVRSASRLGKSDLGANARRIERLRTALERELSAS